MERIKTNLKLAERVENSRIITAGAKFQAYINIGISQISWVTGKIPEFGWTVVLIERFFSVSLTNNLIGAFTMGTIFGFFVIGYVWKKSGLYDKQLVQQTKLSVVGAKVYEAAKIIIARDDERIQKEKVTTKE